MKFYQAKWIHSTKAYDGFNGVPTLLIHNETYFIQVDVKDGAGTLIKVYNKEGHYLLKQYYKEPQEFWAIVKEI